jgi:hypothetical protein
MIQVGVLPTLDDHDHYEVVSKAEGEPWCRGFIVCRATTVDRASERADQVVRWMNDSLHVSAYRVNTLVHQY